MFCVKFATRSCVCEYVRNKSDGSHHGKASVHTPEAISRKTLRRLTKEKATLARETEKMKKCLNFLWLEENVSVPVSWEGKPKNTQCVSAIAGTLIEIDFSRKAYCGLCTDTVSYGTGTVSYGTDTVSYCTGTVSCGADTVSYCTGTVSYGADTVSYGTDTGSYGTDTVSYCTGTVSYGADTVSYGTDTVSYGSSGKKGLPGLCSVLPPASNVGVLCCTATRTVPSVLSHTLYNH